MSQVIFRSSKSGIYTRANSSVNQNSSNPFGLSFKGNLLPCDVFTKKTEESVMQKAASKGKLYTSAIVGSLVSTKNILSEKLNQTVDFVRNIGGQVSKMWKKMNEIQVFPNIFSKAITPNEKVVSKLIEENSARELGIKLIETLG